jgi:hypothetical protein
MHSPHAGALPRTAELRRSSEPSLRLVRASARNTVATLTRILRMARMPSLRSDAPDGEVQQ